MPERRRHLAGVFREAVDDARGELTALARRDGWAIPPGTKGSLKLDQLAVDTAGNPVLLEARDAFRGSSNVYFAPFLLLQNAREWRFARDTSAAFASGIARCARGTAAWAMPSPKKARVPFESGPCRFCAARAGVRSLFLFRRRRHGRIVERWQALEGPETLFHIPYGEIQHGFRRRRGRDVDKTVPALGVVDRTEFDSEFLALARAGFSRSSCLVSHSPLCLPSSRYFLTVSLLRGAVPVRIPAPTTASDRPESSSVGISRPSHGARRIRHRRPSTLDSGVFDP